ncbi:MAG TPA: Wzt carbohydrate-binding domain-containing protein, partial [Acidimicrobiales bacterium]
DSGKTVVIVSHALGLVRDLCDQVALLDRGKLVAVGSPDDVIDTYLGGVERNVRRDGEQGMRFGEGGAAVERVEIFNHDGEPTTLLHFGYPAVFRLHWSTERPIVKPVFRFEFHAPNGTVISAANTRYHERTPDLIEGSGFVDLKVPKMLLVSGVYDLSATIFDYDMLHPYDVRHRFLRFEVARGLPPDVDGYVSLDGRWEGDVLPPQPW